MAEEAPLDRSLGGVRQLAERIGQNVESVIVGKTTILDLLLAALLCEGHVLLEDVPGVGKTMLAKALARSLSLSFKRVQCTPDLLPSDVTGVSVFNQGDNAFVFHPGPVFSHLLLVDEVNRATPRTQSALLEAMEEHQVSVEGETRPLPRPFLVLATQNPIELEGTFPLPEAQLDRFLVRLEMGYPTEAEERRIARRFAEASPLDRLESVASIADLQAAALLTRRVFVAEAVEEYLVRVVRATRSHANVRLGASPRATLALFHVAQALAALRGRSYVIPDDVKALSGPVLAHRIILATGNRLRGQSAGDLVAEAVQSVPVPVEEQARG